MGIEEGKPIPRRPELVIDTPDVKVYNLGQTPAFHLRAKQPLNDTEYDRLIGERVWKWNEIQGKYQYNIALGLVLFPLGEGTEVTGFITSMQGLDALEELSEHFDVSIGLASPEGPSFLEHDKDRDFVSLGCFAKIAAARGIQQSDAKEGITVWQLASPEDPDAISGYKSTQIAARSLDEVRSILTSHPIEIPYYFSGIDMRDVRYFAHESILDGKVIKIDINDFTKTLLSLSPDEQAKFLLKTCKFFSDIEGKLKALSFSKNHLMHSDTIHLGSRTSDSTIFYVADATLLAEVEDIFAQLLTLHEVSVKTVGVTLRGYNDLTYYSDSENDRSWVWSSRVVHTSKPVPEEEWRNLEIQAKEQIAIGERKPWQILFG